MRTEPCPVCNGVKYRRYLERAYRLNGRTLDLVRCARCGLVMVHPMPAVGDVRRLYDEDYFHCDFSCGVRKGTYLESEAMRVGEYREILNEIRKLRPRGKLLEVGCAAGSFLKYAERSGYEVTGVDVSAWAAEQAREQFGLDVHVGRLVEIGLPGESFDVVFLGDLLEHEPLPNEFMKEVLRLLRPGGLAAIKVPTYVNSTYYRTARLFPIFLTFGLINARLLQALKLMHQHPEMPPYHLYEYSLTTMSRLLERNGLSVVGHKTSLLVPEFLDSWNASPLDRAVLAGFKLLRAAVVGLNLPAGHLLIFGIKG